MSSVFELLEASRVAEGGCLQDQPRGTPHQKLSPVSLGLLALGESVKGDLLVELGWGYALPL